MKQPTLYMLIGVPAAGKSTWRANHPSINDSTIVLSTDDKIDAYAKSQSKTYNEVFLQAIEPATQEMNRDFLRAIKNNHNIVWDQTNLTASARKKKLKNIPEHYYKIAIYFPIPSDLEARLASRPGKTIPANVMARMVAQLEKPTFEEGWDEIVEI